MTTIEWANVEHELQQAVDAVQKAIDAVQRGFDGDYDSAGTERSAKFHVRVAMLLLTGSSLRSIVGIDPDEYYYM